MAGLMNMVSRLARGSRTTGTRRPTGGMGRGMGTGMGTRGAAGGRGRRGSMGVEGVARRLMRRAR